jgi:hypothetical protein
MLLGWTSVFETSILRWFVVGMTRPLTMLTAGRCGTSMIGDSQAKAEISLDCYLSWMSRISSHLLSSRNSSVPSLFKSFVPSL